MKVREPSPEAEPSPVERAEIERRRAEVAQAKRRESPGEYRGDMARRWHMSRHLPKPATIAEGARQAIVLYRRARREFT